MNVKHAFIVWLGAGLLAFPTAVVALYVPSWATFVIGAIVVTVYGLATFDYVFPRWATDIRLGRRRARETNARLLLTRFRCECENPERRQYWGRDGRAHCEQCDGLVAPSEQES